MKLNDAFSDEQIAVLDELAKDFKLPEVTAVDVSSYGSKTYTETALRAIHNGLRFFTLAQFAETIDFAEIERLKQEAWAKRMAERADEVCESFVLNFMSALFPKLAKSLPKHFVTMDQDKHTLTLTAITDNEFINNDIEMTYVRDTHELFTVIGTVHFTDNLILFEGSRAPRSQSKGLDAVLTYLEEQK